MNIMNNVRNIKWCRGTTLIEALVAAVVIGVGLLGIASLQMKALQASSEAEYRAKATDIAWALADRMRSNLPAQNNTGYDYLSTSPLSVCSGPPTAVCAAAAGSGSANGVTSCTPTQMAAYDLYDLRCSQDIGVKSVLPGGALTVTCNDADTSNSDPCDPTSEIIITISWVTRDTVLNSGASTDSIVMGVNPGADPGY